MPPSPTDRAATGPLTLWLSSTSAEVAPLLSLLDACQPVELADHRCWEGSLRGRRLWVALVGVGMEPCRRALAYLLEHLRPARVLVVGVAGGLNPVLEVGDVVVADRPVSWPCGPAAPSQPTPLLGAAPAHPGQQMKLRGELSKVLRIVPGIILSWHEPVLDETLRRRLHCQYGADCVDMETGAAAEACAARGVPFQAIRAISDPAGAALEDLGLREHALAIWHATAVALEAVAT